MPLERYFLFFIHNMCSTDSLSCTHLLSCGLHLLFCLCLVWGRMNEQICFGRVDVDNLIHAFSQVKESTSVQQVLLSACLSCDGCVSEDEGQRISQQNLEEINHVLALNKVV